MRGNAEGATSAEDAGGADTTAGVAEAATEDDVDSSASTTATAKEAADADEVRSVSTASGAGEARREAVEEDKRVTGSAMGAAAGCTMECAASHAFRPVREAAGAGSGALTISEGAGTFHIQHRREIRANDKTMQDTAMTYQGRGRTIS
jgi:hypothetical protein